MNDFPEHYCKTIEEAKDLAHSYNCDYFSTKYTPVHREGGGGEVDYIECVKVGQNTPVARVYVRPM